MTPVAGIFDISWIMPSHPGSSSWFERRRLPDIGSDHFPLLVVLDYSLDRSDANEAPQPDAGDKQEAENAIDKGKFID